MNVISHKSQVTGDRIRGLYAIVDNSFSPERSHVELACDFLVGGCRLLQLRMKRPGAWLWNDEVFDIAKEIVELKKRYDFTFIVNDYIDVAAEVGADGLHVGSNDMSIGDVRKRIGSKLLIGYSSHSVPEALAAEREGADYVAFGAIYPTKTKGPGHPIQGVERLRELVGKLHVPVVAIGGIGRTNIDEVCSTGVDSVAMITGLTQAENVVEETKWYVNKIQDSRSKI